jgi:hypothetical protein
VCLNCRPATIYFPVRQTFTNKCSFSMKTVCKRWFYCRPTLCLAGHLRIVCICSINAMFIQAFNMYIYICIYIIVAVSGRDVTDPQYSLGQKTLPLIGLYGCVCLSHRTVIYVCFILHLSVCCSLPYFIILLLQYHVCEDLRFKSRHM